MTILDMNGNPVEQKVRKFSTNNRYSGADLSRLSNDWVSSAMEKADANSWDAYALRVRSRDLMRNDPVAFAVIDTMITNVIGYGLQLQSDINAKKLGVSEEKAAKIQDACEDVFSEWSKDADKARVLNFNEYQRLAFQKIMVDGEAIVLPTWDEQPRKEFGRCLQMLESEELDANWIPNDNTLNGITFDTNGAPKTYWLKKYKKTEGLTTPMNPQAIRARDEMGRPNVLHIFETNRPNQTRGLPKLTPVMSKFQDFNEYLEAEIVAARVAACLAVFVQKNDAITAAQAMGADDYDYYGQRQQDIEPGVINYLEPGETIAVVDPKRNDSIGAFTESIMRIVGMATGLPYELLVKDFSKTNYSSARAALLEARRQFDFYRKWFADKFCQPIYDLVLEEAYYRGRLPITQAQFENKFRLITKAKWNGSPFGQIDEVKETQAAILRINSGLSSYADELTGDGKDWKNVFSQRKRENELSKEYGLDFELSTTLSKGETPEPAGGNSNADTEK